MVSLILQTAARYLQPLLLLFSLFLLAVGHNEPGGGFVGGLVAAAAFALQAIAYDVASARRTLWVDTRFLIGVGLLLAFSGGAVSLLAGQAFLTAQWFAAPLPGAAEVAGVPGEVTLTIGTPLVFDTGVYLVVVGVTLTVLFAMTEE